jgi:hypothetical protein
MLCLKTQIDVTAVLLAMLVQWGVREIFVRRPAYYKEIAMLLFLDYISTFFISPSSAAPACVESANEVFATCLMIASS